MNFPKGGKFDSTKFLLTEKMVLCPWFGRKRDLIILTSFMVIFRQRREEFREGLGKDIGNNPEI